MGNSRYIFFILLIINLFASVKAQISSGGIPYSFGNNIKSELLVESLAGFSESDLEVIESKDLPGLLKPYRFAAEIPVELNSDNSGIWELLPNGSRLWRLGIKSEGALSLNIIFNNYRLPEGGQLFIYNPDRSMVYGAFTSINNKESGILALTPVIGDQIIIEYYEPFYAEFRADLEIEQIAYDYKGFYSLMNKSGDYGRSGACNVDINCEEGQDWQLEKRSVCKFITRGIKLGTGTLVNNTKLNSKPYFLTANHVVGVDQEASTILLFFSYESPECGGADGPLIYSLSGSDILATNNKLDFSLVELSVKPPRVYQPFYAGWDILGNGPSKGVCIHHPRGDVKKISIENNPVVTGNYGSGFDRFTHWRVTAWDVGTTEPGSSGSPLFNEFHYLIGDLTGGDASCEYNFDDFFQKLSRSWADYPEPEKQLKVWLDPDNTGVTQLGGYDPYDNYDLVANFTWMPEEVFAGREVIFQDYSVGFPLNWKWEFPDSEPSISEDKDPGRIMFNSAGIHNVKLIVSNTLNTDTIVKKVHVSNMVDFTSNLTRIVQGGSVNYKDLTTGDPVSREWSFEGGFPELSDKKDPSIIYDMPGFYNVMLGVSFGKGSSYKSINNYIEVINTSIVYKCDFISNIKEYEHTILDSSKVMTGYIPGTNSDQVLGYADRFIDSTGIPKEITRILVPVEKSWATSPSSYVNFVIWDENLVPLAKRDYPLESLIPGTHVIVNFANPVKVDSVFFVGFELDYFINQDVFAVPMAVGRKKTDKNTLYVLRNDDNWYTFPEAFNISSSMAIQPELCSTDIPYKNNILVYPNPTTGIISINFGELVFKDFDIEIFDLMGRRIEYQKDFGYGKLTVDMSALNRGIYLINIRIDGLSLTRKISLIH